MERASWEWAEATATCSVPTSRAAAILIIRAHTIRMGFTPPQSTGAITTTAFDTTVTILLSGSIPAFMDGAFIRGVSEYRGVLDLVAGDGLEHRGSASTADGSRPIRYIHHRRFGSRII